MWIIWGDVSVGGLGRCMVVDGLGSTSMLRRVISFIIVITITIHEIQIHSKEAQNVTTHKMRGRRKAYQHRRAVTNRCVCNSTRAS